MIGRQWLAVVLVCLVVGAAGFGAGAGAVALFSDSETISGSFSVSEDAGGVGTFGSNGTAPNNGTVPDNGTTSENETPPENESAPGNRSNPGNDTDGENDTERGPENGSDRSQDGDDAPTGNASVEVTGVTLEADAIPVGDEAEVHVAVENVGNDTAAFAATLTVDGTASTSGTTDLAPGTSDALTLHHAFDAPGNYTLAAAGRTAGVVTVYEPEPDISIADASVDAATVRPNESVTATATVVNDGTASGDVALDLLVDGTAVGGSSATVQPGETTTVAFQHAFSSPGSYELAIGAASAGTVEVVDPDENETASGDG